MFLVASKSPAANQRQREIIEIVLRNGWNYFRSRLVKEAQPEKPSLPLPEILKRILIELGPTFIKLGQLLSTRPDLLSPEYINVLETLQNQVPALPWSEVEPVLKTTFARPWQELFADIETEALAAGSLAQVHRGKLLEGVKLNQVDLPEARKKKLAALATQVIMQQIYLDRIFHADPHPGNFLYIGDEKQERLALLDCGMIAILDPRTQTILTDLLIGIV